MDIHEKNELLDSLSVCYNRANYLKTIAEEKCTGPAIIDRLDGIIKQLKEALDRLLHDLYENWIGDATELTATIAKNNTQLNKSIEAIEHDIQITQNIVTALGSLEDVIKIAAGLLEKL